MNPTDNYLYYVISDDKGKARGHIIGAQHWVEEKDQDLNPLILKAIDRSARIILEQPPGSELLPKEPQYFHNSIDYIIEDLKIEDPKHVKESKPNSSKKLSPETAEIQSRLKHIKEQVVEIKDGYKRVEDIIKSIQSEANKLKFLDEIENLISESQFEIKLVSLEEHINSIIQAKGNKKIEPLENFNLMEKINEAKQKIQKKEAKLERHVKHLKVQRDHVKKGKSGKVKKASLNTQIRIQEKALQKQNGPSKMDEQAHKAKLHQAWVNGERKKLGKLVDKSFRIHKEPPEIDRVHRSRDKDMADKIIEVVHQAKEEDSEATIMMGTAHLVYTVRTNVIAHLENTFKNDLTGWSVKQVKIKES